MFQQRRQERCGNLGEGPNRDGCCEVVQRRMKWSVVEKSEAKSKAQPMDE
jgi:hypothetical protein